LKLKINPLIIPRLESKGKPMIETVSPISGILLEIGIGWNSVISGHLTKATSMLTSDRTKTGIKGTLPFDPRRTVISLFASAKT
jgi:hypothetical protein